MSSWIKMIDDSDADEDLNLALNQAKTPHGTVDNVLRVHSLRPSTMIGHMKLRKRLIPFQALSLLANWQKDP